MKRFFCFFMMVCAYTATYAQNLTVKAVNLRPQDARAASQPREDSNGNKCAIIRVGVVGVDDLVFPDAIGNVEHAMSEYVVYVPDGLKTLRYENKSGKQLGTIVFDDYDLEINSLASYDVVFESDSHLRSAIFSVQPKNAQLSFNGKNVNIDADGMAMINMPVGEYTYKITANGFESQSGTVALAEDDLSTVTDVMLQEILYPVVINVLPKDATVFIDNVPYTEEDRNDLKLSGGKHSVRITAADHEDDERVINVSNNFLPINVALRENKQEVVKHNEERTRTKVNIRNAFYITGGFAILSAPDMTKLFQKHNAYDFNIELSAVQHFAGYFAMREGISLGGIKSNENEKYIDFAFDNDSLYWMARIDVPLQVGICAPFGKYNQHLFSLYGGGYARLVWLTDYSETDYSFPDDYVRRGDINDCIWDYGIRLSAKLDLSHFTIGVDLGKSLNDMGFSGGICIGVKLYTLSKNKNK